MGKSFIREQIKNNRFVLRDAGGYFFCCISETYRTYRKDYPYLFIIMFVAIRYVTKKVGVKLWKLYSVQEWSFFFMRQQK